MVVVVGGIAVSGDRTALVTGASGELGRAIADRLVADGYRVAGWGGTRRPPGALVFADQVDITDSGAVRGGFERVLAALGRLDVLVHAAGVGGNRLLAGTPDDFWNRMVSVNLDGAMRVARESSRYFLAQRSGAMVWISSLAGQQPRRGQGAYAVTKAGVESMVRVLAREMAGHGIRVNGVAPGFIDSRMVSELPDAERKQIMNHIPLGRWGQPSEVAGVVAYLASAEASYITGQVWTVSGGYAG